ncbi:MAG TPA: YciI family protein [Candidatus Limnocylindrales bacterium]
MSKYLLAYHGGGMPSSPEEQQRVLGAWEAWFGRLGAAVADPGNPCGAARTIAADGSISDGRPSVSGYSVIEATSLDEAVRLAKDCPVLQSGASIEVLETVPAM